MDIFIKSFRRPFALDRCLASVMAHIRNPGRIIVLDDGTEVAHLARIVEKYPGVQLRRSQHALEKIHFINRLFSHWRSVIHQDPEGVDYTRVRMILPPQFDPTSFWISEIEKPGARRFLLLEDDCFITRPLDLKHFDRCMDSQNAIYARLFWLGSPLFSCRDYAVKGSEMAGEPMLQRYVPPSEPEANHLIFQVALAAFHRDYWLAAQRAGSSWVIEAEKFAAAHAYYIAHPKRNTLLRSEDECIGHGFSTSCTVRGQDILNDFNVFGVNDALTDDWMEAGPLPLNASGDWQEASVMDVIDRRLGAGYAVKWQSWRREVIAFQEGLGLGFKLPV